jgi:hypothetical protein
MKGLSGQDNQEKPAKKGLFGHDSQDGTSRIG